MLGTALRDLNTLPTPERKNDSSCYWKVIAMFIFDCACGVLTTSCLLYLRTIFGSRRPIVPEECSMDPIDIGYKKVKLVAVKVVKDDKK